MTYSSGHGSQLGVGIISRRNLDDISRDEVDTLKTSDNRA